MISMQSCFTSFFHAPGVFCRGHHVMCVVLSWISSPWHILTLRMGGLTMCHVQTPCCAWPNQKHMETWNAFPAWIILNPAPPKDWTAVTCVSVIRPLQQQKVGTYRCGRSGAAQNMALGLAKILRSDDLELAEGAEAYERVAPEPEGLGQKPRGLTKECKAGLRNEANPFFGVWFRKEFRHVRARWVFVQSYLVWTSPEFRPGSTGSAGDSDSKAKVVALWSTAAYFACVLANIVTMDTKTGLEGRKVSSS